MEQTTNNSTRNSFDLPTSMQEVSRIILVGAGVGLLVALMAELIARFFIGPVFCRTADTAAVCSSAETYGFNAALVIVSIVAVVVLVKLNVFRPLLVALGPAISLWSLSKPLGSLQVLEYGFWIVTLFSLAYVLFFWVLRVRSFIAAIIAFIIVLVAIRLIFIV